MLRHPWLSSTSGCRLFRCVMVIVRRLGEGRSASAQSCRSSMLIDRSRRHLDRRRRGRRTASARRRTARAVRQRVDGAVHHPRLRRSCRRLIRLRTGSPVTNSVASLPVVDAQHAHRMGVRGHLADAQRPNRRPMFEQLERWRECRSAVRSGEVGCRIITASGRYAGALGHPAARRAGSPAGAACRPGPAPTGA